MLVLCRYAQPTGRGPNATQSKVLCGPVWVLAVVRVCYILTTYPYFANLELEIFYAGYLPSLVDVITSVTIVVRIRTLSAH